MQSLTLVVATSVLTGLAAGQFPQLSDVKLPYGDDVLAPAAGDQEEPFVAAGDSGHLVVWTDLRSNPESSFGGAQSDRDLYAARLDVSGALLDPIPIVVSAEYGAQSSPRAAWNGSHWLVAWDNQSPTTFYYAGEVLAVRVATDGTVIDDPPLSLVKYESSSSFDFALTANGTDWCVVARGTSAGPETDTVARRVAADGSLPEPAPVVIEPGSGSLTFGLDVTAAGGEYLAHWSKSGLVGRRLDANLNVIGDIPIPGNTIASNGSEYYVVWSSGGSYVGSPMSTTGALAVPAGAALTPAGSILELDYKTVSWDGAFWWVAWRHAIEGIEATRVARGGSVLDPDGVPFDPAHEQDVLDTAAAGAPGGGLRLVWKDNRASGIGPNDIRAGGFTPAMRPVADDVISLGLPTQSAPDMAAGSNGYLMVHRSAISGEQRILAQRLDGFGNSLADPVELATGGPVGYPDVDWNGSLYLVTWPQDAQILGRRVAADGTPIDAVPIVIMSGYSSDVAALGDDFLVIATYQTISPEFIHPFAMRIDGTTGSLLDPAPFALGQYYARNLDVTTFGGRWLATWQRNFSHDDTAAEIRAIFIAPDGSTAGDFNLGFGGEPDVSASDTTGLIVWRTGTDSSSNPDLVGRRLLADGTLLDTSSGFPVAVEVDKQTAPATVWDGVEFTAAWQDQRTAATFFDERTDIYAARITEGGIVLDTGAFPVFDEESPTRQPQLATFQGRRLLAAGRLLHEAGAYRVALRGLGPWEGLGNALSGTAGEPVLDADGAFTLGQVIELAVSSAVPGGAGVHAVGFSRFDLPLFGGVLVPFPQIPLVFATDGVGRATTLTPMLGAVPAGLEVFVQSWILDPGGPQGWAATNAVRTAAP